MGDESSSVMGYSRNLSASNSLCLCLSTIGCSLEQRIQGYGALEPRNSREQIIFDYHQVLKERRFSDAYQFIRGSEYFDDRRHFISNRKTDHQQLPTLIAIGEEYKYEQGDRCDYLYEVFHIGPGHTQVRSVYVLLHAHPDKPGKCQIRGYKAVF
ncbi:MAG: hypothetical protein AAF329_09710 [Cyanobacteria bacterium P01_A01_bin.17]